MPKMKSNRGAMKRFKVTKSGKVKHRRANRSHILTKKSKKRKRHLRQDKCMAPQDAKNIKRLLSKSAF